MFYIVKAVVDKEAQFGNDAHLIVNAGAQLIAYGFHILAHIFEHLIALSNKDVAAQVAEWKASLGQKIEKANADLAQVNYEYKCN